MTPEQFAYWLQGFAELNQQAPNQEQWQAIREHIASVFKKETPPVQFRLSEEKIDPIQESIRRFNEQQAREKMGRIVDPGYWQGPTITC